MPFESKQQSKACFATNGFGGKVDCKEWADKTNYKSIPSKKTSANPQKKHLFNSHPFMGKK